MLIIFYRLLKRNEIHKFFLKNFLNNKHPNVKLTMEKQINS